MTEGQAVADCKVEWRSWGAVFTISRPQRLNALNGAVSAALSDCIDVLEAIEGRRFLVVSGAEDKAFSVGADLDEASTSTLEQNIARSDMMRSLLFRLHRSEVFSIAAINGLAFGGGLELAMACTIRLASRRAQMGLPEIKLGVMPSYGGTQFLPALIGRGRALDMILTGRAVGAEEALMIGLVDRICDADPFEDALAYVEMLFEQNWKALSAIRRCVMAADSVTVQGMAVEQDAQRDLLESFDVAEGIRAFREKRKPRFNKD